MSEGTIDLRKVLPHLNMSISLDKLFTDQDKRNEGRFSFMNLSLKAEGNNNTNKMALSITGSIHNNEADIPTFEINDSDEDVIFIAEYHNTITQNVAREISPIAQYPSRIDSRGTETASSSSSSIYSSPEMPGSKAPRRNPTRRARSSTYKRKCSDYVTEEDLNLLIASDEESSMKVVENSPAAKETRPKKVVINKWPAEGLHERPQYNEQTEEIDKFDFSIRQIQNSVKRAKTEKPKKLKVPKKNYAPKKYSYKKKQNKKSVKKEKVELVPFEEVSGLINDTFKFLSGSFFKNVVETRRAGLHMCMLPNTSEDKENQPEEHTRCLTNLNELMINQSVLYCLSNGDIDFEDVYNELTNEID